MSYDLNGICHFTKITAKFQHCLHILHKKHETERNRKRLTSITQNKIEIKLYSIPLTKKQSMF